MQMGLLDDAIREHLELKRLRGADPGLVAHEEREALSPAHADEPLGDEGAGAEFAFASDPTEVHQRRARISDGHAHRVSAGAESLSVDQETVEFDMRAVLYEEHPEQTLTAVGPVGPMADVSRGTAGAAVDGPEQRQLRFGQRL